jgi:antitoxin HigA-1
MHKLKHALNTTATMLYGRESKLSSAMNTYGSRLNEALRLAEKERQELAREIDISVQAIAQVIAGKTKALTAENSARAARYLGVNSFWLATGEGEPRPNVEAASPIAGGQEDAGWPFPNIDVRRVTGMDSVSQAWVEGRLEGIIEMAESRIEDAKRKIAAQG